MSIYKSYLIFLIITCISCSDNNIEKPQTFLTIDVQPFSDMSKEQISLVCKGIKNIYPNIELKDPIELPAMAFYKERNRYRADSIIKFFRHREKEGHMVIALTNKDISTTKGDIKDYGIMGLGLCPGNVCVVSSYRLAKNDNWSQFFKVALHELGHTQGLPHCPVKICFMRDAEGKNHTDEETGFCSKCKAYLVSKGWVL